MSDLGGQRWWATVEISQGVEAEVEIGLNNAGAPVVVMAAITANIQLVPGGIATKHLRGRWLQEALIAAATEDMRPSPRPS